MKFKKILLIDIDEGKLAAETWKKLDSLAQERVFLSKDSPAIKKELVDVDCLLVNFGVTVDKSQIDAAPNLKYIGVLATAFGKIDVAEAKKKGIPVCNLAGYSTESVAEFVLASLLDEIRKVEEGKVRGRSGNYSELGLTATEIKGKIFGILGLGTIGRRVAEIALGFSADVRYWSRNRKKDFELAGGVRYENADKLISHSDFLSLHFAWNKDTDKFLSNKRLMSLKSGAVVINTAPMELIDLNGLQKRLKKGDITFIFDHSDEFAPEHMKRFSKYKNFVIYPPIAYITKEAVQAKQDIFISNIENFLKGTPRNIVN